MDPRHEINLRRAWFYETQLRGLNYSSFRGLSPGSPDARLSLISEAAGPVGGVGSRPKMVGPVYLDDQQPVWTPDERARRDTLSGKLIAEMGDWLGFVKPRRLVEALSAVKAVYENSKYSSEIDLGVVATFERTQPNLGAEETPPGRDDGTAAAMSRAEIASAKPWLIPELYHTNYRTKDEKTTSAETWIRNLEQFITNFENETQLVLGGLSGPNLSFDLSDTRGYQATIRFMLSTTPSRRASDAVRVRVLDRYKKNPKDADLTWRFLPGLQTSGFSMDVPANFTFSTGVGYWARVMANPLKEVAVLKANSDMGLCQLVRLFYRYGTLPATLGAEADLTWRKRSAPDDTYTAFFAEKAKDPAVVADPMLQGRLQVAQAKLSIILQESQAHPRSAAPTFSPLAAEIVKQGLKSYKFWIDEHLKAKQHKALNKVKGDIMPGVSDSKPDLEMEFWSENHYIMFASSEYLLGQLWEDEEFQPGKLFLEPDDKSGILKGTNRKERGRARVLKWLNNRLLFGWTEFHSTGYYREHLWAILNLADFSLDEEVRTKATMAVDLLLFDVLRYEHRGTMGAPGGRSQFKSKSDGWDNDLGDVIELILGNRGIFNEADSQIGCSFSTSTYSIPDVLLQVGTSPPSYPFTDRSRVSITFDEAAKYGITWSMKSDTKDSVQQAYAAKREKHYGFLEHVNGEIARTHTDYGSVDDDTVFFWTMSAFFNKQVVRNTFATVRKFKLDASPIFGNFVEVLIKWILPVIRRAEHGLLGAAVAGVAGAVVGVFESDVMGSDLEEGAADDLSIFVEGSTRTRANIFAYRSPDAMLASIQNFRTGQLNLQSSVHQATLNPEISVFTTAGFAGFDISDLTAAAVGAGVGALFGGAGAIIGGVGAVIANQAGVEDTNPLGGDEDGPGWWTGYWALPMVVQHGGAAIIAYDFHRFQSILAEVSSHVWFPKAGFDRTVERRTSAYDNADFFLLDITDIGPKGFWLFGKVIHPPADRATDDPREGYVGVFSNQRPDWLNQDFHLYKSRLEEHDKAIDDAKDAIDSKLEELEDDDTVGYVGRQVIETVVKRSVDEHYVPDIDHDAWLTAVVTDLNQSSAAILAKRRDAIKNLAGMYIDLFNLQRIWKKPFPVDYFADRDWYVEGKNIWIIQVGSKAEFGSFESFMDRVSSARVHISDTGDMECTYDIPKPDGTSDRLTLDYANGGQFALNGGPLQTDLYPRFENPFVRGGRVEWGQREYLLEWNGASLLHDLSDFEHPVRQEGPTVGPGDSENIKALVIYLKTEDESMGAFTVATATVDIACTAVATNEVVAAGPVGEDTQHDADWIFFDKATPRSPNMTITLTHPASSDGDATPEWTASFALKALMADWALKDCQLRGGSLEFEDHRRCVGPLPFTVAMSTWAPWDQLPDGKPATLWTVAAHPLYTTCWHPFNDLVVLDTGHRLWNRRLTCGGLTGQWEAVDVTDEPGPDWSQPYSLAAASNQEGNTNVFVVSGGRLLARSRPETGTWRLPWVDIAPTTTGAGVLGLSVTTPVGLGPTSTVTATFSPDSFSGIDLYVTAADGDVYYKVDWLSGDDGAWTALSASGFTLARGVPVQAAGGYVFGLGDDHALWGVNVAAASLGIGAWQRLTEPGVNVARFEARGGGPVHLAVRATNGEVRICELVDPNAARWTAVGNVSPESGLAWAEPTPGHWWLFGCGTDGFVAGMTVSDGGSPTMWAPVGAAKTRVAMHPSGTLIAVCRAIGEIELLGQAKSGEVMRTWWS